MNSLVRSCLCLCTLGWTLSLFGQGQELFPEVAEVRSQTFSDDHLLEIQKSLGITIGARLNLVDIDKRIRLSFGRTFESLLVEGEWIQKRYVVTLTGSRIRSLRKLKITNLDDAITRDAAQRVGLAEGARFDSRAQVAIEESMRIYLREQGYYRSIVETRITDVAKSEHSDLEIVGILGEPTLVKTLNIAGVEESDAEVLKKLAPLKVGQAIRRELVDRSSQAIVQYLQDLQYLGVRVRDVSIEFTNDMAAVDVSFEVTTGRRLQLEFVGNRVFDDVFLKRLITEDILVEIDAKNQLAQIIVRKYREIGYHFCEVEVSDEDRPETLIRRVSIREGARVIIDVVQVVGGQKNDFIESLFFERAPGVIERRVFCEQGLEGASRNLEEALKEKGFLKARVNSVKPIFTSDNRGVQLLMEVELGVQAFVGTVELIGFTQFPKEQIEQWVGLRSAEEFSSKQLETSVNRAQENYLESGFLDAKVESRMEEVHGIEKLIINIRIQVVEGIQYSIGKISVHGNLRTEQDTILREMHLKTGDVFVPSLVSKSEEDIGLLGIFSRVELLAHSSLTNPRQKDIKISVSETRPGIGEVGIGAFIEHPRLRLRSFMGAAYRNLFGRNHTVSARGELALPFSKDNFIPFVEYSTILGLRVPYPANLPFIFNMQLGVDRFELSTKGPKLINRKRIEERLEWKLSKYSTIYYRLHRFEHAGTQDLSQAVQDPAVVIGSTGPGIIIDMRDDLFNPQGGSYHTLDIEYAHPSLLSNDDVNFAMLISRNSFYAPFLLSTQLKLFLGMGYARSLDERYGVPKVRLVNEMALGGQQSIRGFLLRGLSPPEDAFDSAFYNARVELGFPIFGDFGAALFFDTGKIFPNITSSERGSIEKRGDGVGVGIRYKTLFGPLVVDFAKGLNSTEDLTLYFSLGSI